MIQLNVVTFIIHSYLQKTGNASIEKSLFSEVGSNLQRSCTNYRTLDEVYDQSKDEHNPLAGFGKAGIKSSCVYMT